MTGLSESMQAKVTQTIETMRAGDIDTMDVAGAALFFVSTNPDQGEGTIPLAQLTHDHQTYYVFQKGH